MDKPGSAVKELAVWPFQVPRAVRQEVLHMSKCPRCCYTAGTCFLRKGST